MTDRELMQQALEALEGLEALLLSMGLTHLIVYGDAEKAITALREALAEQPAQQPVAVVSGYYGGQCVILPTDPARIFNSNTPLYTSPPQRTWVGLTDEELELLNDCGDTDSYKFARAIEAKLKEKNT